MGRGKRSPATASTMSRKSWAGRETLSKDILELAEEVAGQLGSKVFQTRIHRGVGVAMAPAHGQTVLTYQTVESWSLSMNSRRGTVNSTSAADSIMSEGSTSPKNFLQFFRCTSVLFYRPVVY